ncbi:MAG: carbon storage regulator CsrA [Pirellulaceae bacterium]
MVIDGQITVKVLKVRGNSISIGIEAPGDVPIRRGELQTFIAEELKFEEADEPADDLRLLAG